MKAKIRGFLSMAPSGASALVLVIMKLELSSEGTETRK
jgi:hypothetical protein